MRNAAILALILGAFALNGCGGGTKPDPAPVEEVGDSEEGDYSDQGDMSDEDKGSKTQGAIGKSKFDYESREVGSIGYSLDPEALDDAESPLSQRVIYFEYDSSQVPEKYNEIVLGHSAFLLQNSDYKITIEGHTDEKGSREYNIGLGDRRANSVKQVMELSGVAPEQLEVVSYGEEKLADSDQSEVAQAQNRRAVIVYSKK